MAAVAFERVTKRFGTRTVLDDLSFEVPDGEFWAVLGPSGSGKSTVLRLVAGLDEPSGGNVLIGGEKVNGRPPGERDVAFVFQSYALYPHLTVFENIAFPLRVAGLSRDVVRDRVEAVAALLQLSDRLHNRPRQLSGGQRQRVAIGRAVVRQPRAFLFDEPLSNLDQRLRVATRLELIALHRRLQTTALYVTHDQEEAMTLGQRIVLLNDSRLQQIGTPAEIYRRPRNLFVAGFVGSPRMNLLEGQVVDGRFRSRAGVVDVDVPRGVSGEVTLGIRPDHVTPGVEHGLAVEVDVVEDLGRERHVHVRAGDVRLAIVDRRDRTYRLGEQLTVTFDPLNLHWFKDGSRIGSESDVP